jgi:hypothetical protein
LLDELPNFRARAFAPSASVQVDLQWIPLTDECNEFLMRFNKKLMVEDDSGGHQKLWMSWLSMRSKEKWQIVRNMNGTISQTGGLWKEAELWWTMGIQTGILVRLCLLEFNGCTQIVSVNRTFPECCNLAPTFSGLIRVSK